MKTKYFNHEKPVWRERADFIIHAMANASDNQTDELQLEQLWCKKLANDEFEVCCIPFFVYDLALGDVVGTSAQAEKTYVMNRVIAPSGRYTFRVWFGEPAYQPTLPQVLRDLHALGCLMEFYSLNLLGVDAENAAHAQAVADLLWGYQQAHQLVYETGRT